MKKHNLYAHRLHRGFTLVELAVVIGLLGILATVGMVSYVQVQKQSRDSVRKTDITTMQSQLEKFYDDNGVYPPGCPQANCNSSFIFNNTSAAVINSTMSRSSLRSIFPNLSDKFGDPSAINDTTPIMDRNAADIRYYYFGGALNTTGSADAMSYGTTTTMPCYARTNLDPGETSSYLIGYYSEGDKKWQLFQGKHGKPFTLSGGASLGCVVVR